MDPISSFEHVLNNVQTWKTQLTDLSAYAVQRHDEFVAEYSRLLFKAKAQKPKSASIASLHSSDEEEEGSTNVRPKAQSKSPQPSELVEISPFEAGNRFIYAQAHRKRKPGTSLRSNASGPRNFRSKQMVVIYYDSHIQTELEKLVKGLGAARNNLRKGKNAYNAAKGFALPSFSRRYESTEGLVKNPLARSSPRLSKTQSEPTVATAAVPASGEAAFQQADKELEIIQNLCETAAHQVIRDGDCKVELSDATSKLDTLLTLSQSTLELLRAEKKRDEEEAQTAENGSVSDNTSTQSTLCEKPSIETFGLQHKTLPPLLESLDHEKRPALPGTVSAPPGLLVTDTIEVDDDDDDDDSSVEIDLNIASYRAAGRARIMA